jgi:hypothetical protein
MEWIQTGSIIITILLTAYYVRRDILGDIKAVREEMRDQSSGTDRLYEMFIDLLKDGKK